MITQVTPRPLILTFQVPPESSEAVARSLGPRQRICPWEPERDWSLLDRDDVAALVLSDGGRPEAACAWIRRLRERVPALPVIFLARQHSHALEMEVRRAGIHYYLHDTAVELELPMVLEALERRFGA